nr:complex I subunit 1 family protein [uncultured Cohaesibacter sp.]
MTSAFSSVLSMETLISFFAASLFGIAFSLFLKGVDRKLIARLQGRQGPPLGQPFHDVAKLMRKQILIPDDSVSILFLAVPMLGVASMVLAVCLLPFPLWHPLAFGGDLLVLLYLMTVPGIAIMLAGSSSGSVYGSLGFSREMSLILAYEGPLLFALVSVAIFVGQSTGSFAVFSLREIVAYQKAHGPLLLEPFMWPALLTYLACLPATLGVGPFDIAEAETEILEGPLIEYSGPPLAFLQLMQAMQRLVVLALGVILFAPNGPDGVLGLLVFVVKLSLFAAVAITLLRASMGRMRIDQAFLFFFTWPEALGFIGLILIFAFV